MSISGRKKVSDMSGNHLFSIVKEHLHIHATYVVEGKDGSKLCEVKSGFKCKFMNLGWGDGRGSGVEANAICVNSGWIESDSNVYVARGETRGLDHAG